MYILLLRCMWPCDRSKPNDLGLLGCEWKVEQWLETHSTHYVRWGWTGKPNIIRWTYSMSNYYGRTLSWLALRHWCSPTQFCQRHRSICSYCWIHHQDTSSWFRIHHLIRKVYPWFRHSWAMIKSCASAQRRNGCLQWELGILALRLHVRGFVGEGYQQSSPLLWSGRERHRERSSWFALCCDRFF